MTLKLHHLFVCTFVGAPEAEYLIDAGLVEGSANTHPGQGTANRRFFFERGKTANPFGICLSSEEGVGIGLPFPSWSYRPEYLDKERCIHFADKLYLAEPEVFVLSWPQAQSPPSIEPTSHPLGLGQMRSVSIGLVDPTLISDSLRAIKDAKLVKIHRSAAPELVIEFTSLQEVRHRVPALGISIVGRPDKAA